jgi:ribonuclease P protein component
MTELLESSAQPQETGRMAGARSAAASLTLSGRSWRVRAHEEDLSTEEGEAEQDARVPEAQQDAGRPQRAEAPPRQGTREAHADLAEEVASRAGVRFTKAARLLRRREFLAVQERGARLHSGKYVVLGLPNGCGHARLGVTVSSKVANAVGRNRVKRWVREAFRARAGELPKVDLVVIGRSSALTAGLKGAQDALAAAERTLARGG